MSYTNNPVVEPPVEQTTYPKLSEVYDAGYRVALRVYVDFTGALDKYVTIQDTATLSITSLTPSQPGKLRELTEEELAKRTGVTKSWVFEYFVADPTTDTDTGSRSFSLSLATTKKDHTVGEVKHTDYENALLQYCTYTEREGSFEGKPNKTGQPDAMKKALSGSTLKISVEGAIEDDPTR